MKVRLFNKDGDFVGITSRNIFVNMPKQGNVFIGLRNKSKCDTCSKPLTKVYICYYSSDQKTKNRNFCKVCYRKRKHEDHRIIALEYSEDIYDEYEYLNDLFSEIDE